MKRIILSLVAIFMVTSMFAIDITKQRKDLLATVKKTTGVTAAGINKDNGNTIDLNFSKEYFQINLQEQSGFVKVTISTTGFNIKSKDEKVVVYEVGTGINAKFHSVKVKIEPTRVGFEEQLFVKDMSAFSTEVIRHYLNNLLEAKRDFSSTYRAVNQNYTNARRARERRDSIRRADSISNHKITSGDSTIVVEVERISKLQTVGTVEVKNVDAHNNEIASDGVLKASDIQYLSFTIKTKSSEKKDYKISARIINPAGVPIITDTDNRTSFTFTISTEKNKEKTTTTEPFGNTSQNIWVPGTYKVEFYEGDAKLTTVNFTLK